MKKIYLITALLGSFVILSAQNMRKLNREGVSAYTDSAYNDAEFAFRKAREADSTSFEATYNIANSLYKQGKFEEAGKLFDDLSASVEDKTYMSNIHHNLGNSYLQAQEYEKSIEAYKNALRIAPGDDESRYNLAYAKAKLQQQQQQQQQDQQQNNEQNDDQQQQDQQQEENDNENQQQAEAMKSLSKEDMERLLQAIQQQEIEVQEKLEEEKAKAPKTRTEKDW